MADLSYEQLEPQTPADACVIWLHGLGADGHDFVPALPYLNLPQSLAVRFILPHAPVRPMTSHGGQLLNAWYDMDIQAGRRIADDQSFAQSAHSLSALIAEQVAAGIAPERILLVGFSQGGAMALDLALSYPQRLAGVVALSTYLARGESLAQRLSEANRGLPVLAMQGTQDDIVAPELSAAMVEWLQQQGYPVSVYHYPMAHQVIPQQLAEIGQWLSARLQATEQI